jgi:hypothetical protein
MIVYDVPWAAATSSTCMFFGTLLFRAESDPHRPESMENTNDDCLLFLTFDD